MSKKGKIYKKMTNEKGVEVIEKSMFIYYYLTHEEYGWILIQLLDINSIKYMREIIEFMGGV